jgi:hypothetical protein
MFKKQPLLSRRSLQPGWFCFFLVAAVATSARTEQPFLGPIPVQFVNPGQEFVLDMHRFFHPSGKFKLDYQVRKDVDVVFDGASFQLRVRPTKVGLFDIPLSVASDHGTTPGVLTLVAAPGASTHRFTFKSAAPVTKVYIGGVFNGWSNNKTPLTGPDKNGEYTVDLPLEPGRYAYKFFVDGKWVLDPTNAQTEDNGLGDKNSVVTIGSEKQTAAPTIYAEQLTSGKLKV